MSDFNTWIKNYNANRKIDMVTCFVAATHDFRNEFSFIRDRQNAFMFRDEELFSWGSCRRF